MHSRRGSGFLAGRWISSGFHFPPSTVLSSYPTLPLTFLTLSRAGAELPDQLFEFSSRLLVLDLSHNKLVEVEADFGKLNLLSTLKLNNNLITSIHPNIGMCIR